MTEPSLPGTAIALGVGASLVALLSLWALSFSHGCSSDGCIGVVLPIGGGLVALAIQLAVLLPMHVLRRRRATPPAATHAWRWLLLSLAAFVLPLLFADL